MLSEINRILPPMTIAATEITIQSANGTKYKNISNLRSATIKISDSSIDSAENKISAIDMITAYNNIVRCVESRNCWKLPVAYNIIREKSSKKRNSVIRLVKRNNSGFFFIRQRANITDNNKKRQ